MRCPVACYLALFLTLAVHTCAQAQAIRAEAVAGTPFGMGRIILPINSHLDSERLDTHLMAVTSKDDRVFYPAVRYTQPLGMVRDVLGLPPQDESPNQLHIHFLFTGNEPIELEVSMPKPLTFTIVPQGRKLAYTRLLRAWWIRYKAAARRQMQDGDYSPAVETYLTSMLSRRMQLTPLPRDEIQSDGKSLSMLLGTEKVRLSMIRDAVEGRTRRNLPLDQALPREIDWPNDVSPEIPADVKTEPIAHYVPEECFYIRFSQFANYLWLRKLLEEYGGDLSRMVMLRGTDSQLNQIVENQLGLRESALSSILGPQVISDIAMIGNDTYLQEGAAIGILFEAKNDLLTNELMKQRRQRVKEMESVGGTETTIQIDGHEVSFASTEDNQLRSFYVSSGKYHLVTNCRQIVKRFLECDNSVRTLGDSDEFRYARSLIPLGEDNTLFVYLSRRFFEGLLSPQYQIEVPRRLRAITDLQLTDLATLAAAAEGYGDEPITMQRLVDLKFLRDNVDIRSDGSRNTVVGDQIVDSVRGARGTFLPVPDSPIANITRDESIEFQKTVDFHQNRWQQMDPVLVGLRRTVLDGQTERVEVQARMLPLNQKKYGVFTDLFGPPTKERIKPLDDDIVSVQAYVDGGNWAVPPHHLYFGLRDLAPNNEYSKRRFLKSLQVARTAPAYVAAWPSPGVLDSLGMVGRDDGNGYRKMLLGLFRLNTDRGFSFLSFDKDILGNVATRMEAETVEEAAQLRVLVGDVKNSKFGVWANGLDFQRAWETSVGNVHLMHLLTQQLHVPLAKSKDVAERILNAELICPLDGDYKLQQNTDGTERWASTAWLDGKQAGSDRYVSPLMTWLRGLELNVTIEEDRIVANGLLDIEREKKEDGLQLPNFNFFGGGKAKQ